MKGRWISSSEPEDERQNNHFQYYMNMDISRTNHAKNLHFDCSKISYSTNYEKNSAF